MQQALSSLACHWEGGEAGIPRVAVDLKHNGGKGHKVCGLSQTA